jgi:hypothetical protein
MVRTAWFFSSWSAKSSDSNVHRSPDDNYGDNDDDNDDNGDNDDNDDNDNSSCDGDDVND